MPNSSTVRSEPIDRGFFKNWRFASWFSWRQSEEPGRTRLSDELKGYYPDNAVTIIKFMTNVLRRRQDIVEKLKKHPELNDHGFFMVICLMYMDTYKGIGYTSSRLVNIIELFSTSEISTGTAARRLQKANDVAVFVAETDAKDSRKQRYYLSPEMIRLCSEAFGGMIEDVLADFATPSQAAAGDTSSAAS